MSLEQAQWRFPCACAVAVPAPCRLDTL